LASDDTLQVLDRFLDYANSNVRNMQRIFQTVLLA